MDYKMDFENYWAAMRPAAKYDNRKESARQEWNAHPEKHAAIMGKMNGDIKMDQTRTNTLSRSKGFLGILSDIFGIGKAAAGLISSAKTGKIERGAIYDYQLRRIHGAKRYVDEYYDYLPISTQSNGCLEARPLLDINYVGDNGVSGWYMPMENGGPNVDWNFEWSYETPDTPCGYEILKGTEGTFIADWKLKAKLNEGDEWILIDEQTNKNDWMTNGLYDYFKLKETDRPWRYFRLEITKTGESSNGVHIQNFRLVY